MTRINYHRPQGTCCNSNSNSNRGNNKFYKNIIYILNYDYDYLPSSIFFLSSVFCLLSSIFYPCLLFSFFYRYHTRLQVDMNVVYECSTCVHMSCVCSCVLHQQYQRTSMHVLAVYFFNYSHSHSQNNFFWINNVTCALHHHWHVSNTCYGRQTSISFSFSVPLPCLFSLSGLFAPPPPSSPPPFPVNSYVKYTANVSNNTTPPYTVSKGGTS